ncbi:SGNH/GDSL hydrolase family protein [Flavihumibacter fluvii]|uniref:SGNH/GDSL hydrolase family protein n=1 Tax=Flavihumibacter fluvii TaxID=2838157 RepID=UPI001BDED9E6|nr:SGNH/GDSL hydrolase family protein [Flavihumibacter fluvii]ULQ53912.1 SGNH/GDSL hydrolase family protein [Flavihumibacter fluvii]
MSPLKTYLALGDSYTIGEKVLLKDSFPYQLVQLLRKNSLQFTAPEIIAKTGWTTDELLSGIEKMELLPAYDLVTLLIGVNNQYRGRATENYSQEFTILLKMAIQFATQKPKQVIVLSIPDWGVTPFAANRNRQEIAEKIDAFNAINKTIALDYGVNYVDITTGTREAATRKDLVAEDGLHPSSVDYARWAEKIVTRISPLR